MIDIILLMRWYYVNTYYIIIIVVRRLYCGEGADVSMYWSLVEESIDGTCEWNAKLNCLYGNIVTLVM